MSKRLSEEIGIKQSLIFSGGTGRSGTTIVARLLSRHSAITMAKPAEIKFLTSGNGLLDLSSGKRVGRYRRLLVTDRLHLERFKYRLYRDWWIRDAKDGSKTGLSSGITKEELDQIFAELKTNFEKDKQQAIQVFMNRYVNIQLGQSRGRIWIDTTPVNIFRAKEIAQLFPDAKFVHMIRDGRDVISSVIRERWGPSSYEEGLLWYRKRMLRNVQNVLELDGKVITIALEDLVINDREMQLQKLLKFLKIKPEKKLIEFFNTVVLASSVSQGRWRDEVDDVKKFNQSYADLLTELKELDPSLPLDI